MKQLKLEVTMGEFIAALEEHEEYIHSAYQFSIKEYIKYVLDQENSPFSMVDEKVTLKKHPFSLNDIAYEYFIQNARTQDFQRVCQHVIQKGKISPEKLQMNFNLEGDIRFAQLIHLDRWFLTEWEICNNEVYQWTQKENLLQTNLVDLYQLVNTRLQETDQPAKIFIPDTDPRFEIRKKGRVFVHNSMKEETAVEKQKAFDLVIEQIKETIELLHMRNEEMSEEVVQHFNAHNLEAIQTLMAEKKDSLELQQDLTSIIDKWENRG